MGIRVLLVDDHQIFREGLKKVLEEDGRVKVVGEAANGIQAVEQAERVRPDVVIMDIGMALFNGVEATREVMRRKFGRVVVLSMYDDVETVSQAIEAGCMGYVLKSDAGKELIEAIEVVGRGDRFFSRALAKGLRESLANRTIDTAPVAGRLNALSPRQRQVLQLVAEGHRNKRIAEVLGITIETVKSHRKHLKEVLGIRSVAGLTQFAIQAGLVRRPHRGASPGK